ncbi:methylated-DNA--[protein]-cysteine S-methyltransferase [Lactobacillus sp. 0.1XD8-4]|uniref:methylated-DNA--[protein]-cysteine S-methyltransferase n=1 Tax=uncultured Limosilactobacillus sp. TaxID=2837629 RepID=UPI00129DCA78|nr:methylated-DNA--[protein]-cysteine S-methyltransferase [uncultured Limosilactobacillus sp.]MRN07197.1 methylated-DNA--[protein]-cysteine S-methyltransferase [Lactobacillus sp. 0.1XD8-4]
MMTILAEIEKGVPDQAQKTINWLNQYFAGQNPSYDGLHIKPKSTPFQSQVYQALEKVPYGQTTTYKELSDIIQHNAEPKKNLSRAVGNAVGHNQILLIIPCHRVVASNGAITGYAGGIERKRALLKLEGVAGWN